jgi:type IV pilus assembly protein PilO
MEKFKGFAWHIQLLILVGIAAVLYMGVWYFVTSPTRAETQEISDKVAQLKSQNEAAKVATQRINEFRSLYASKTQEYDELKVLLPEEREITNVLQGLQDTANESRLIVMRFSPRDDSQQEFIMAKPVEIEVDSNFNNLRAFFEKMAKLQRIVSISDFKLNLLEKQTGDRTLHAQFLLTAYYASPENLNNVNNPQPNQPNGQTPLPNGQPPVPNTQPAVVNQTIPAVKPPVSQ